MTGDDPLFRVQMLGMPLLVRERSRQHGADLLREMTLLRVSGEADTTPDATAATAQLPVRLLELAHELDTCYGPYVASSTQEMDDALDAGQDSLDVTYELPTSSVAFVQHVAQVLREVEVYCHADRYLLTLAPPADVAAYRDWSINEVVRQHAGLTPITWPAYAQTHLPG